jgi:hypothetical protein
MKDREFSPKKSDLKGHQSLITRANIQQQKQFLVYWKCVLGLEAEKTFLSCFEAGLRILWGRGNLILLFCDEKKCTERVQFVVKVMTFSMLLQLSLRLFQ